MISPLLLTGQDIIEIIFFSTIIYALSLWLKKDQQKKLLPYFYTYCFCVLVAHHAQLPTISHFFYTSSAFIIMFFAFIHQRTLQKNFITLQRAVSSSTQSDDWIEALLQNSLIALNNNKQFSCIIEHTDMLSTIIDAEFTLNAPLSKPLLTLIMNSSSYDHTRMMWIKSNGIVHGINARWCYDRNEHVDMAPHEDSVKQEALFFTSKTDALLFTVDQKTRTASIVVHGTRKDMISMHDARTIIKQYLSTTTTQSTSSRSNKENNYASHRTHTTHTQQRSS